MLLSLFISACKKSDITNKNAYEQSLQTWLKFKENSNDTYKYTVSQYLWPNQRSITIITVANGKITQRYYKNISTKGLENIPKKALGWVENESNLNTHINNPAAQAITFDQVYEIAKTTWLLKEKDSTSIFEAKNNCMISICGFNREGCVDDCFVGINITSIEKL